VRFVDERIDYRNAAYYRPVLQIFSVKNLRPRHARGMNNHRVPKRNVRQPVQLDGCNHVDLREAHHPPTAQQFNLALRKLRIHTKPCRCRSVMTRIAQACFSGDEASSA
jgi:hypothetical protein